MGQLPCHLCCARVCRSRAIPLPHLPAAIKLLGSAYSQPLVSPTRSFIRAANHAVAQCSTFQYYEIIQGCVAITADIAMLLIGLPLLMQVRVPLKQKLILVVIFGMGVFVIVAAILTKVYCLVPELISYVYMNWYFRETTVAILVTNLPLIWSLLRDVFPALKSWTGGSKRGTNRYRSGPWNSNPSGLKHYGTGTGTTHLRSGDEFPMHKYDRSVVVTPQKDMSEVSLEHTYSRGQSDDGSERALQIRQDVTIEVMRESRPPANYHLHDPQP